MLVPPVVAVAAILRRRGEWSGRQRVFWMTIAAGAAMWFVGQVGWSIDEILLAHPLPWFNGFIILQLCASAMPLIALAAAPHRGPRSESAPTAWLDICALACLTAFLYWSLIVGPGMAPQHAARSLRMLATIGPLVRLTTLGGLLGAAWAAGASPWRRVFLRLSIGVAMAFA